MNNFDISGILKTYSEKAAKAKTTKQLRNILRDLKQELDLRKVKMVGEGE